MVQRGISSLLVRRTGCTVASGARTGAVTLIQRFGSALTLNPHLHMLFLDGAYTFNGGATFHRVHMFGVRVKCQSKPILFRVTFKGDCRDRIRRDGETARSILV